MENNIAALRKKHNLSQKELAHLVGISSNWLSHIESGGRKPSMTVIEKIAECLKVKKSDLFLD